MNKSPRTGVCPVCLGEKPLTKEHVPPKALFLNPRPKNTITVWTCEGCNQGTKRDDEYFRICITAGAAPRTKLWRLWRSKVMGKTFKRSPPLLEDLLGTMRALKVHHTAEPLEMLDGRRLTDTEVENVIGLDMARVNAVIEKIVRCLHFHHGGSPLPKDTAMEIAMDGTTRQEFDLAVEQPTGYIGPRGIEFSYHRRAGARPGWWDWFLVFYRHRHFRVSVRTP
jgi:hypothetical protein